MSPSVARLIKLPQKRPQESVDAACEAMDDESAGREQPAARYVEEATEPVTKG